MLSDSERGHVSHPAEALNDWLRPAHTPGTPHETLHPHARRKEPIHPAEEWHLDHNDARRVFVEFF
jgi:hypothetical protein